MPSHAPISLAARTARTARLAIAGLVCGAVISPASASPQGQHVVAGSVTFSHSGGHWIITASDGSIINYSSFHINPNEIVQFVQPGQLAAVLNRITGGEPTQIMGTLLANGQVYFVNPAGVFFLPGSVVDVGGIYAAAGNMSNADFLAGVNRFTGLNGWVVNQGTINADTTAALIGKHVGNWGQINAPDGVIAMVAGDHVMLSEIDGHLMVQIDGHDLTGQSVPHGGTTAPSLDGRPGVLNAGEINAPHGQVVLGAGDMYALAVHNSGSIHAAGGQITMAAADGAVYNSGTLDVSVESGTAGSITVQGPSVVNEGLIAADSDSGAAGDIEVTSQHHTYLLDGSIISASGGTGTADGGEIFVHSYDGLTVFADGAFLDASGGATGGHGGYAEVSGSQLIFNGTVDLTSADGAHLGTLALDPDSIIIADVGSSDGLITPGGGVIAFIDAAGLTVTISDEALEAVIGHIVLSSLGDILIQHQVALTGGPHDVTLHAHGDIVFDAAITGAHHLQAIADFDHDGVGDLTINVDLTQISGNATFGGHEIHLNGSAVTALGTLVFQDAVVLGDDMTLTGSSITFQSTVDSEAEKNYSLSLFGGTTFQGDVGQAEDGALGDLFVFGSATIGSDAESELDITTLGVQQYDETVTIASEVVALTASEVRFTDTVEGATAGGQSLIIDSDVTFGGGVGEVTERMLDSLLVTGTAHINGGFINTVHGQTYEGAVFLGQDTTLTSFDGGDIHFLSTIDSGADLSEIDESFPLFGPFDLLVDTSGSTIFEGTVGGLHQLDVLTTVGGGETRIGADMFTNRIRFFDDVRMIESAELNGLDSVEFFNTIIGDGYDLTVNSPFTLFNGQVADMGLLHTDSDGETHIAADISGDTIHFDDVVRLVNPSFGDEGDVASGTPEPSTIVVTGFSDVDFAQTVDGLHHLVVHSGGDATFGGAVGESEALASLSVDSEGDTQIIGGLIITEFGQSYLGEVTLGDDTSLISQQGGDIHFFSTVDSGLLPGEGQVAGFEGTFGEFDLSVDTSGLTIFGGAVGGNHQLDALTTIGGGQTVIDDNMFANSLEFHDAVALTDSVELNGFDSVRFLNTLAGDGHNLFVNSPHTFFAGAVSDMGLLETDSAGTTFIAADIAGDSIIFEDAVILGPELFLDGGVASGIPLPPPPLTIHVTGDSFVEFQSTVDGAHHLVVDSGGDAIFGGSVGFLDPLQSLTVSSVGDTQINGGFVQTLGEQLYLGAVTLGDDTFLRSLQDGDIHFFSTVDSGQGQFEGEVAGFGSFGPFDLLVDTGGVTSFDGVVGGTNQLDILETFGGGETRIGADMFANGMEFFDSVRMIGDAVLTGFDFVGFFSTIQGDGHDLAINSPETVFLGDVTDMGTLHTDADGTTFIAADISGDVLRFDDPVVLGFELDDEGGPAGGFGGGPQTFVVSGDTLVDFGQTIDGHHHLIVNSGGLAHFGGDIGSSIELASFEFNVEGVTILGGSLIQAEGDISFNPDGHDHVPLIASIAAPHGSLQIISTVGHFYMGVNEKLTVVGDLLISALFGSATLGDLSTLGDMIVLAQHIFLQTREPGLVLNPDGTTTMDMGLDFVAGGRIIFSTAPTPLGGGPAFFATSLINPASGAIELSDTLAAFLVFLFGHVSASQFEFEGQVLDLAILGGGGFFGGGGGGSGLAQFDTSNPVGAIAADLPVTDDAHGVINDSTATDATRREALRRMNLFTRLADAQELLDTTANRNLWLNAPTKLDPAVSDYQITLNRLRRASVIEVADRYSAMFLEQSTDPATGELVFNDRSPQIRQAISRSWEAYAVEAGANASAEGYREFLASHPDYVAARQYLNDLNGIYRQVAVMGVTPAEMRNSLDGVLGSVKPASMTQAQLEATIAAGVI